MESPTTGTDRTFPVVLWIAFAGLAVLLAVFLALVLSGRSGEGTKDHPIASTGSTRSTLDPGPFPPLPQLPAQRAGATLPPDLFLGNPPGSDTVIDREDAAKVALAVRTADLDAIEARQLADVGQVSTSFERWDGVVSAVEGVPFKRANDADVTVHDVLVPPGDTYPATFVAILTWPHDAAVSSRLQVYERRDRSSPWRVALSAGYEGQPLDLSAPSSAPSAVASRDLHRQLAEYYRSWKEERHPPVGTRFEGGANTSEPGAKLAAVPQDGDYGRGIRLHEAFRPADRSWAFEVPDGHLECGSVWHISDYDGAHQVWDRSNWGNTLAPGDYRWIREAELWMSCILERGDGGLIVYGGDGESAVARTAAGDGAIDSEILKVSKGVPGLDAPPYW